MFVDALSALKWFRAFDSVLCAFFQGQRFCFFFFLTGCFLLTSVLTPASEDRSQSCCIREHLSPLLNTTPDQRGHVATHMWRERSRVPARGGPEAQFTENIPSVSALVLLGFTFPYHLVLRFDRMLRSNTSEDASSDFPLSPGLSEH